MLPTLYNVGSCLSISQVCFKVVIPEEYKRGQNLLFGPAKQ